MYFIILAGNLLSGFSQFWCSAVPSSIAQIAGEYTKLKQLIKVYISPNLTIT
ncbi:MULTISPECIES: hypothetical protein [unclassified Microcoleus]|uniref:hypothetical protein n=1 Tax=unclassified Microcoleus TaxID=2642155 RepID=UPI002FCE9BB0